MLKLSKKNEGKWFAVPGEFFEKDEVKLKLKVLTQDQLRKIRKMEIRPNKVTGKIYEHENKDRTEKGMRKVLFDSTLEWSGIEEDFNEENFNDFINVYGAVKTGKTYDEEKEKHVDQHLSGWIVETCTDASKIIVEDDEENLKTSS